MSTSPVAYTLLSRSTPLRNVKVSSPVSLVTGERLKTSLRVLLGFRSARLPSQSCSRLATRVRVAESTYLHTTCGARSEKSEIGFGVLVRRWLSFYSLRFRHTAQQRAQEEGRARLGQGAPLQRRVKHGPVELVEL
eukprot:CAMPEP_0118872094 /NCGR_PEP_ID=MMETSP1163-20130328/14426_1 /TAXON_ID=124430 /ORGANISM="Phaeomonas parva, Strain CCMP2877" /LENGTH=135 /DNA_ID=CAMNT_0006807249 /DNA_START=144 /DNA_END=551 /DNA_ORIENTATION=+